MYSFKSIRTLCKLCITVFIQFRWNHRSTTYINSRSNNSFYSSKPIILGTNSREILFMEMFQLWLETCWNCIGKISFSVESSSLSVHLLFIRSNSRNDLNQSQKITIQLILLAVIWWSSFLWICHIKLNEILFFIK